MDRRQPEGRGAGCAGAARDRIGRLWARFVGKRPTPPNPDAARLLVELDADVLDDLAVLFVVAADELRELYGDRISGSRLPDTLSFSAKSARARSLLHFGAQRGHDRLRRARRREQAEPDVDRIAGIELADGRQVGEALGAVLAAGRRARATGRLRSAARSRSPRTAPWCPPRPSPWSPVRRRGTARAGGRCRRAA